MNKFPVWLDCDTGVDDAIALMALHALEEVELLGISAVCGNALLDDTFANTHRVCGLIGASYPIYRGASKPLYGEPHVSTAFHGQNGLGDVELPIPETAVMHDKPAWDALHEAALAHPGELQLIAIGPLTNVAIALTKYPDLASLLHTILIMGGSASVGNVTPAAEFNIYVDPHAAQIVFKSGVPIVMCGLDVTLKAVLTPDDWDELAATGSKAGSFTRDCLQQPWRMLQAMGFAGVPMHDSCPVLYLVHPELFSAEEAGVYVETQGTITQGKTVTDLYSDKQFEKKNATVVLDVSRDRFIRVLKDAIRRLP